MTALHSINDPRRELLALLAEQQGKPSYGNPARRFAFMLAERISANHTWYDSNENAVRFLDAFAQIAGRMAGRSSRRSAVGVSRRGCGVGSRRRAWMLMTTGAE